jgi:integrase/recombinase XerC
MTIITIDSHLAQEIAHWLQYLQKNLNYSEKTILAYRFNMHHFVKKISEKLQKSVTFSMVIHLGLVDFRTYFEERKHDDLLTHRSLARNLSAIKSFFAYQERHTHLRNEELAHFTIYFKNRLLPKPIEQQDLQEILNYLQVHSHVQEWVRNRNYTLAILLYGCGVRISEALSLTINDIAYGQNYLKIFGKGNKVRHVPYMEIIRKAFETYLNHCPYQLSASDYVFVGVQGKKLNPRVFYEVLKQAYGYLNIPYPFSAHNFRHSCASHLLNNGANLRMIQSLMGHKTLSATENYLKVNHEHLRNVINKAHPRLK